jgi:carbon storage regulator
MLVLTRRPGQALLIGDSIEIYVAEIRGDVVRLSIKAPRDVSILRREVLDAIQQENTEAATAEPALLEHLTLELVADDSPSAASEQISSTPPEKSA